MVSARRQHSRRRGRSALWRTGWGPCSAGAWSTKYRKEPPEMIRSRGMPQVVREVERRQYTEPGDLLLGADLPVVLRVAAELYAQDRAQIERAAQCQELKQAAAEA